MKVAGRWAKSNTSCVADEVFFASCIFLTKTIHKLTASPRQLKASRKSPAVTTHLQKNGSLCLPRVRVLLSRPFLPRSNMWAWISRCMFAGAVSCTDRSPRPSQPHSPCFQTAKLVVKTCCISIILVYLAVEDDKYPCALAYLHRRKEHFRGE